MDVLDVLVALDILATCVKFWGIFPMYQVTPAYLKKSVYECARISMQLFLTEFNSGIQESYIEL